MIQYPINFGGSHLGVNFQQISNTCIYITAHLRSSLTWILLHISSRVSYIIVLCKDSLWAPPDSVHNWLFLGPRVEPHLFGSHYTNRRHVCRTLAHREELKTRTTMMTSSNGNIFRVTGHLCGEFTGPRWIHHTMASDAELWCLLWSTSE